MKAIINSCSIIWNNTIIAESNNFSVCSFSIERTYVFREFDNPFNGSAILQNVSILDQNLFLEAFKDGNIFIGFIVNKNIIVIRAIMTGYIYDANEINVTFTSRPLIIEL